jgi:2-polyprenyl-3-methyl-5-hydroxy-6-metoxy-1,4-benzoquinol methylase
MIETDSTATQACPLCDGRVSRRLWSLEFPSYSGPFTLWRCRDCGVVYNWPRLSPEQIADQYDGDYYVFTESSERRWGRATQVYLNYLLPLENELKGRRLLDIGSAQGHLLALARARGWDVQGVEVSAEAAARARDAFDIPVQVGSLEEVSGEIGQFDVAISIDVIEHVPDPRGFLEVIRRHLAPGGRVIIETPNWGGPWRRFGGRRWLGQNQFHLYLFDARSLLRLFRASGYTRCRALSSTNFMHTMWGMRPEVTGLTRRLPGGLRWRVERALNQCSPPSPARTLRDHAPASLDGALTLISDIASEPSFPSMLSGSMIGDNLAVVGQVSTADNPARPRARQAR